MYVCIQRYKTDQNPIVNGLLHSRMAYRTSSGEVEKVLKRKDSSIFDIIMCENVSQEFRAENEVLMKRIVNPAAIIEIFDILREKNDRNVQRKVTTLFQTSNMSLNQFFADDMEVTENAIVKTLEEVSSIATYAAGTIARFLNRAFEAWPDDVSEVCRKSKVIYPTAIRALDRPIVFQFIADLMSDNHKGMIIFMWHCFIAMTGRDATEFKRPPDVFLERDLDEKFELSDVHKTNIIELMRMFFVLKKERNPEFQNTIRTWAEGLSAEETTPLIWGLMKVLKPSEMLAIRAYEIAIRNKVDMKVREAVLTYLGGCSSVLELVQIERMVLKVLLMRGISNFGMFAWLGIVNGAAEDEQKKQKFKADMTHIIGYAWTRIEDDERSRAFLMEAAVALKDVEEGIAEWSSFMIFVTRWSDPETDWSEMYVNRDMFDFGHAVDDQFIENLSR